MSAWLSSLLSLFFFFFLLPPLSPPFFFLISFKLSSLVLCQINPEKAREEFRSATQKNGGTGVQDFMNGMGLGMLADQVKLYMEFLILQYNLIL